jgi:hypothetical protein
MIDITKHKTIFIRIGESAAPALVQFEHTLEKTTGFVAIDAASFSSLAELKIAVLAENPGATLFLELDWLKGSKLSFETSWQEWNVVLVKGAKADDSSLLPWLQVFSCLDLTSLPETELSKAIELAIAPGKLPGIVALCGAGAEIYFEKVTRMKGMGQKLDFFLDQLETKFPELAGQMYNLRQLTYSLVHQALNTSASVSKIVPVVDFQIAAEEDRIVFSTRFSAPPKIVTRWAAEMAANENFLLRNASLCADMLVFTELSDLQQVEIKALVASTGDYSGAAGHSVLLATVPNFIPDPALLEAQSKAKFQPLTVLAAGENIAPPATALSPAEIATIAQEAGDTPVQAGMGTQLNFKLKAGMLEAEKTNLQGLVKKKSSLISELTKDVNRAQREVLEAQKGATKEILKMRMETEKAKNEARDAKKKLIVFQRRAAEAAEEKSKQKEEDAVPKKDFEKELKQAELGKRNLESQLKEQMEKAGKADEILQKSRKEVGQLTGEINLLKQKLVQIAQRAATNSAIDSAGQKVGESEIDKFKALQKNLAEAKGKEHDLEKAVKALALKLDAAEKNLKVNEATFTKQLEAGEKAMEEAKRQRSEIVSKLEDAKLDAKKKLEESNERDRTLRKQIEEQKAKLEALEKAASPLAKAS